jgi:hypothetical protein
MIKGKTEMFECKFQKLYLPKILRYVNEKTVPSESETNNTEREKAVHASKIHLPDTDEAIIN